MKSRLHLLAGLLMLCLGYGPPAKATHMMGGDISLRPVPNSDRYIARIVFYRDSLGVTAPASLECMIRITDAASNTVYGPYYDTIPMVPGQSYSFLPGFPYGVQVFVYEDTLNVPFTTGRFEVFAHNCCRNNAIQNMTSPGTQTGVYYAAVDRDPMLLPIKNYSPEFLATPVVYIPLNQPWTYNPVPYDANGDSLVFSLKTPMTAGNSAFFQPGFVPGYTLPPGDPSGPFTLNPVTGEITWTPNMPGNFVATIGVTDLYDTTSPNFSYTFHPGQSIRDMQYIVVASNQPVPSFTMVSPYQTNAAPAYNYAYYTPGTPLQFLIKAGDAGANPLFMTCNSALFKGATPPQFSYAPTGAGNTVQGVFSWTPPANETKDRIVAFRAGNGQFFKDMTIVFRKAPPGQPGSIQGTTGEVNGFSAFPNPASNALSVSLHGTAALSEASLGLYDVTGRLVKTLFRGDVPAGAWSRSFFLNVAAGSYVLQLRQGGRQVVSQKVLVQR